MSPFPLLALAIVFTVVTGLMAHRLQSMGYFGKGGHLPDYGSAPVFRLTERSGKTLDRSDLDKKVWVADFIFTRCPGPCPLMSLRAQELLAQIPLLTVVSFTSDPDYDTPEVLTGYADRYKADPDRWLFLTGAKEEINRIASEFKFGRIDSPDMHTTRFVLVDRKGQIRGYYDSNDAEHLVRLNRDIRSLL